MRVRLNLEPSLCNLCGRLTYEGECENCRSALCFSCQAIKKEACCQDMQKSFWPGFMKDEVAALKANMQTDPKALPRFLEAYNTTEEMVLNEFQRVYGRLKV